MTLTGTTGTSISVNGVTTGRLSGSNGLNHSNFKTSFKYMYGDKVRIQAIDGSYLNAIVKTRTATPTGNYYDLNIVDSANTSWIMYGGISELDIFPPTEYNIGVDMGVNESKSVCHHEFVNVSFNRIKMVCKHCDMEQGALPKYEDRC
jgi:hypothetical protein